MGKGLHFQNTAEITEYPYGKKIPQFIPCNKNQTNDSKEIIVLNVEATIIKLLEDNLRENPLHLIVGRFFFR